MQFSFWAFWFTRMQLPSRRLPNLCAIFFSTQANIHFIAVPSLLCVRRGQLAIFIDYLIGFPLMFCSSGLLSRGKIRFVRDARNANFETGKPAQVQFTVSRYAAISCGGTCLFNVDPNPVGCERQTDRTARTAGGRIENKTSSACICMRLDGDGVRFDIALSNCDRFDHRRSD